MTSISSKLVIACLTLACAGQAMAADPATPSAPGSDPLRNTTLKLIELLVEQGVLTREKADALIREANQPGPAASAAVPAAAAPATAPGADGTVHVPYVPEFVREQLKDEIRSDLMAEAKQEGWAPPGSVPDWVRSMKWEGDLRVRFEHDSFGSDNAPEINVLATNTNRALALANTTESTDRERIRVRAGFTADLDEQTSVGVRISSGSASNPVSENQTLGNYDERYTTTFDRAYLKFQPTPWFGATFGRFANPLVGTELVWAPDLSFDGLETKFTPTLWDDSKPFLTWMASPVQEIDLGSHNKYLFSTQGGIDQTFSEITHGKLALGYYRYIGIEGVVSPPGTTTDEYTAPVFAQQGNTYYNISSDPTKPLLGLASAYRLADLVGSVDTLVTGPYHATFTVDWVKNLGFNAAAVSARVGEPVAAKTTGYLLRLQYGVPEIRQRNDWQIFGTYKHVERDAVLDAFTDPDFHLGGTDAKGYVVGGSYGLAHNTWATLRYYSTDSINGPPLAIDIVQFDLNARF